MVRERLLWAPPPAELPVDAVGHLPAWEKIEADGTW